MHVRTVEVWVQSSTAPGAAKGCWMWHSVPELFRESKAGYNCWQVVGSNVLQ
jgi:hypothetical protein